MNNTRYAVVVGTDLPPGLVEDETSESIPVRRCRGPEHSICPLAVALPCFLRSDASVSVVNLSDWDGQPSNALWRCAAESDSPTIGVVPGMTKAWQVRPGLVIVGADKGAAGIEEAIELLATERQ